MIPTYYPMFIMLENSLKSTTDYVKDPLGWPSKLMWHNYAAAWSGIHQYFWNTLFVGVIAVLIGIAAAAMSAYVFARYKFPGKEIFFALYLGLLMIPGIMTLIGQFLEIKDLGLLNTWWSLILPYAAGSQALGVFILRTFFATIPEELFEAARVDGATNGYLFLRIAVPLAIPSLGTVSILGILNVWGDYLWPTLALSTANKYTISAGIMQYAGSFSTLVPQGNIFASYVIAAVPVMVLIGVTMRYYLAGILGGSLKL
jgi:ABC-type glycerol-3-phosphate transport system permease component